MKNSLVKFVSMIIMFSMLSTTIAAALSFEENFQIETEDQTLMPLSDIPEVLTMSEVLQRGHTARLREEETDMHSAVFQNRDGTKSLYVFASPIKYEASDGTIKDKRTTITQTSNSYNVIDNDVQMSFGNASGDGTRLEYANTTVTLTPLSSESNATAVLSENTLLYNDAFGTNTMVAYSPLLSGIKSTIIVKAPISNNSFTYTLNTSGITDVTKGNDGVIELSDWDNKAIYNIGIYIVTDANGKVAEGEMQLKQNENGEYTVTANIDESFLTSEDTEYPIMVEPTITVNTSSAINDAVIYSGKPNKNYGAYNYHNVGKLDDSYGVGRLLVSFPGLENNATYNSLTHNQIRKAEYNMYFASGIDSTFWIDVYRQNVFDWSENSITWNQTISHTTVNTGDVLMVSSNARSKKYGGFDGGERLSINITGVIRDARELSSYISKGIILQNDQEDASGRCINLCSTEYADSHNGNYMPYLTIDYVTAGNYISINFKIYIDNAFVTKCRIMGVGIQNRIDTLMSDTVNKFRNDYGIDISYTYVLYETPTDASNCPNKSAIGRLCECYDLCDGRLYDEDTMHHTNRDYIMKGFPESDTTACFNMLMTGRKTCDDDLYGTCKGTYDANGECYSGNRIGIFCTDKYDTSYDAIIQMVIFHEIGHLYETKDHYGETELETGMSDFCVYGDDNYDFLCYNNLTLCDYCRHRIENNITLYNHQ